MIAEHLEDALAEWRLVEAGYELYRSVLAGAGVPVNLDEAGRPTRGDGTPRDLADCLEDLARRCREAERTAGEFAGAIPESCPLSGRPFACIEEHPDRGWIALYADPAGVLHSIPEMRDGGPAAGLAYDPRSGSWSGEVAPFRAVREEDLERLRQRGDAAAEARRLVADLEAKLAEADGREVERGRRTRAIEAQRDILVALLRDMAAAIEDRTKRWFPRPFDAEMVRRAVELCDAATGR